MADNFQQVIEVALRSATDPSLRVLLEDLRDLGTQGELTDEQLSAVTGAVEELNQQAAAANGLQASITALQQYRGEQERLADAVDKAALRLKLAAEQESASAAALKQSEQALAELRAERDRYNASEERTTEGARQFAASLKEAQAAQKAAQAEYAAAAGTLRQATTEYDRAVTAQDKLTANIGKSEDAIKAAGLSVEDLGNAQAELQKRLAQTGATTQTLATNLREQVAVNQQAAAAARQNAAAQQALADANATLGRRSFAEVRAEIEKVRQAYETLRASGTLTGRELAQAQSLTIERTRQLRAEYGSLGQSLRQVQGSLIAAGASLFTATRLLGNAAAAASQFQRSLAAISTIAPQADLDALGASVRELTREFGGDASRNAAALYEIIAAGVEDTTQALQILRVANQLAIGGLADTEVAASGLVATLNAYGLAAEEATRVSDAFFVAAAAGNTTIEELSQSIGGVAPLAASVGVSVEQLTSAVGALTAGGLDTGQAFTQIQSALTAVVKPTAEAKRAAEELGIQFDVAALRSQGLQQFLQGVSTAAQGNETTLATLFGRVEALQGVLALTGNQADAFAKALSDMENGAGRTAEALAKLQDTPEGRLRVFRAAVADLELSFGQAVTSLTPLLDGLTSLINLFNELPAGVRTTVAGLGALTAVVAPLAIAIVQSRAALVLLLGSLRAIGPAAASAGAGVGVFTTSVTGATAASGALRFSLLALGTVLTSVGVAFAGFKAGDVLAESLNEARVASSEAGQAVIRMSQEIQAAGEAGRLQAAEFSNFASVQVKSAEASAQLGEAQREAYRVALEGLEQYLLGRGRELIAIKQRGEATSQELAELGQVNARLVQVRASFEGLDQAGLGAAKSIAAISEAVDFSAVATLALNLRAAAKDGKALGDALAAAFDGIDFENGASRLAELALGLEKAASGGTAAAIAIRDGLAQELAKLSGEELLRFQQAAQFAFDSAGASAGAASQVLDATLAESYRRLGVNVEAAGVKITEQGREIIASFRAIAASGNASAQAIGAAFSAALNKAQTTGEVQALEEALRAAFTAGKISAQQLGAALSAAGARTADITNGALEAQGAIAGISDAGRRMTRELIATLQASRATLAAEANVIAQKIGEAFATGAPTEALREQLAGIEAQIQGANTQISDLEKGVAGIGDESARTADRSNDSFNKIRDDLKSAALQAKETAAAVGGIGDESQQAGEEVELGVSNALLGLIQVTKDARDAVAELGPAAVEAFDRLRGELGVVNTTGRSTADVMQLIADRAAAAARNAEELKLQVGDTEAAVKRTREEMARLAQQTAEATDELASLNRQLQDEADRRAGNEEAVRRREYEEQLRRIAELERKGGQSAATQANQARELARRNFEADLREIREREREQINSNRRVDDDRRRASGTSSGGGGLAPVRAPAAPPPIAPNITINGVTDPQEVARKVAVELDRLQRRGFNPRTGT